MILLSSHTMRRKSWDMEPRERLGKDSRKPFDSCCLCLKPFIDPLCCQKGHVFCKECILECLLSQKKDIQRYIALFVVSLVCYVATFSFSGNAFPFLYSIWA